jgi:nucleotide-binding universal stress UspA family protein
METLQAARRITLSKILFATDFSSYSNAALTYALAVARHYGAKLYAAHVLPYTVPAPDAWPGYPDQEQDLRQDAAARLEDQVRGVPHEVLTGVGDVWSVLSQLVGEHQIDLLVVGSHGRTGVKKLLMGSIAEKIFRHATCPVLTVGPHVSGEPTGETRFPHILFATDFSEESLSALPYAISLAEENQSRLALLHVVREPAVGIVGLEAVRASLMLRLRELVPAEAESWCAVECLVEFGGQFTSPSPGERILEIAANRGVDLIVLGVRATRGALSPVTHLAYTTAQHIVAHATCPVLTVRGVKHHRDTEAPGLKEI